MEVVDRKPVPIYEVECCECHSKIEYKACEAVYSHITCPVCGVSNWAYTIRPVRMESSEESVLDCDECCGCDILSQEDCPNYVTIENDGTYE